MSVHRVKQRSGRDAARAAAFYDLDGTLAGLNLINAAIYLLGNLGEWNGRLRYLAGLIVRIPALYRAEQQDRHLLNVVLFEVFKGVSRDRLVTLGEEYCDRMLMKHIYPQAVEMVEANRSAGLEPVLVTGSPDFIVEPLARRLGIKEFAANRLIYSRGHATGRLREPVMAGDHKAAWCVAYARANGLELEACWGYADSYYDLPFLAGLGHPVAVNPDRRLSATARSRQWPIIRFAKAAEGRTLAGMDRAGVEAWVERRLNGAAGS
jgi:HAD superfamily hydrolase (TIGR01490 family)